MRSVDIPKMEKIVLANLGICKCDTNLLQSIDQADEEGIMINMMIADSDAVARSKSERGNLAEAEEILGEHHSKRAKLDNTFTAGGELHNVNGLITILSNILCLCNFWFKFEMEDGSSLLSIVCASRMLPS